MTKSELINKIADVDFDINDLQNHYNEDLRSIGEIRGSGVYQNDVRMGTGAAAAAHGYPTSGVHGNVSLNYLDSHMASTSSQINTLKTTRAGLQSQLDAINTIEVNTSNATTAAANTQFAEKQADLTEKQTELTQQQTVLKNYATQNTKYIIIGVIAFIVIAAAIFYFFKKNKVSI